MIFLRSAILFLLALIVAIPAMAQSAPAPFRGFIWGVSPEDVRHFEKAIFYKEDKGSLLFLDQPDEFRRLIRYDFDGGKLWRARYDYVELTLPNSAAVMDRVADLERELTSQYGKPSKQELIWKNRLYANYPQFWARSFLSGDLKFRTEWDFGDTKIVLQSFHDDLYYQLFYTAEKTNAVKMDQSRNILNLPGAKP